MKKILLIEDNPEMRENTSEILELADYEVITAENGKIGVDLASKEKPDLIICDVMMPVLDGHGVLFMLSKNPETRTIPFIFLTAKAEKTDFRKGMELGADDYLTKPFDDIDLLNAVESRLKKSDILRAEFSKDLDGLNEFVNEARGHDELKKLSDNRKIRTYKKKEILFVEGNMPHYLYFISKGKIKTYKENEYGKEYITNLYKEGDFLGYLALLDGSTYTESAMALEESEICIIPKDDFFALIHKNRDVSAKFIRMLSDNLMEKEELLLKLAYDSVRKRVAEALLLLRKKYQKDDEPVFSITITREDLANIVGTATETVIRTLSDFKDEKLIEIKGGNITIINAAKLARV
jgi:CRP/FNR family transcriptional regulator, polysaccharide utilization system transcription regulator